MTQHHTAVDFLRSEGIPNLAAAADRLQEAPELLGIDNEAEVRTVRLIGSDGSVRNVATVLYAGGPAPSDDPPSIQIAQGRLHLLRRTIDLTALTTADRLRTTLDEWPSLAASSTQWFQYEQQPYRTLSMPEAGYPPHWQITVGSDQKHQQGNWPSETRGPFYESRSGFFADDLSAVLGRWIPLPSNEGKWEPDGSIRIVLCDQRAYFTQVDIGTETASFVVSARKDLRVTCVAKFEDGNGKRTIQHLELPGSEGSFELPRTTRAVALHLFDQSGNFYDSAQSGMFSSSAFGLLRGFRSARLPERRGTLEQDTSDGESVHVEFKEWLPPRATQEKHSELLKTLCAFANAEGGRLYIGVNDEGEIRGIDQNLRREYGKASQGDVDEERRLYAKAIWEAVRDGLQPDLNVQLEWLDHAGASVLCVRVESGERKPYFVVSTRETFIRKGGTSRRAEPHEILRFARSEDSLGRMNYPRR